MLRPMPAALALAALLVAAGCSKRREVAADHGSAAPQGADCSHAACGPHFFVDTAQQGSCSAGGACALTLTLVATGDFHLNEEYPYEFKADDVPGVTFRGTDPSGANVFSKGASDWQKTGPQRGVVTVSFQPRERGSKRLSGIFKLSVCSAQTCQLEQPAIATAVAIE